MLCAYVYVCFDVCVCVRSLYTIVLMAGVRVCVCISFSSNVRMRNTLNTHKYLYKQVDRSQSDARTLLHVRDTCIAYTEGKKLVYFTQYWYHFASRVIEFVRE